MGMAMPTTLTVHCENILNKIRKISGDKGKHSIKNKNTILMETDILSFIFKYNHKINFTNTLFILTVRFLINEIDI